MFINFKIKTIYICLVIFKFLYEKEMNIYLNKKISMYIKKLLYIF